MPMHDFVLYTVNSLQVVVGQLQGAKGGVWRRFAGQITISMAFPNHPDAGLRGLSVKAKDLHLRSIHLVGYLGF
jgi:hypothetical protein